MAFMFCMCVPFDMKNIFIVPMITGDSSLGMVCLRLKVCFLLLFFFRHKLLLPFLDNISKQSQGSKISGPLAAWYYSLTMPSLVYLLAVLVCENVLVDFQGPVYIGTIAYIVRSAMKSSHRLNHISR